MIVTPAQTDLAFSPTASLTPYQQALYTRIQAYELDAMDVKVPFRQRLAREQGWRLATVACAIAEYKNFLFLAIVADHPVSPSPAVDAVWHIHVLETRAYWQELCPQVLGRDLHDVPSIGGQAEAVKFQGIYRQTLASYQHFLGHPGPGSIWPDPQPPHRLGREPVTDRWMRFVLAGFLTVAVFAGFTSKAYGDDALQPELGSIGQSVSPATASASSTATHRNSIQQRMGRVGVTSRRLRLSVVDREFA